MRQIPRHKEHQHHHKSIAKMVAFRQLVMEVWLAHWTKCIIITTGTKLALNSLFEYVAFVQNKVFGGCRLLHCCGVNNKGHFTELVQFRDWYWSVANIYLEMAPRNYLYTRLWSLVANQQREWGTSMTPQMDWSLSIVLMQQHNAWSNPTSYSVLCCVYL